MKHIIKRSSPELRRWFKGQPIVDGRRINVSYDDMPPDVKEAVKQSLLDEQGGLCCYTGIRMDEDKSHIEHLKPQSRCVDHEDVDHEDVDYANLLAAYPSNECPFGARAKDEWYDVQLLVSPLDKRCESCFRFDLSGGIKPANENDPAVIETIRRLCLDHGSLTEMRKQAINKALFPRSHRRSEAQLYKITQSYCARNTRRQFPHFCFVIQQTAQELLGKIERRRKRKQAIRRQSRK